MKQTVLFAALGVVALGAGAQEVGNVLSSQPVVQQVAVPRQLCNNQVVQAPNTGGGALLGGLTGAAVGSAFGGGSGRAAALGVGAILGAVVGSNVEAQNNTRVVPNCVTENTYENRTVAWNVTYEYSGRQYTVQMPYDPGPTVRLQVSAVGATDGYANTGQGNMAQGQVVSAPAVQTVSAPVIMAPQPPAAVVYSGYPYPYPAYPVYQPYYYPPVSLSFGYVFRGGGGHRHWR
ncbi:MAG: hypothetical protein JWQ76_999 [Ramlibacter sp.]|nr:hypothetical protein [Ramlibacter sp.]